MFPLLAAIVLTISPELIQQAFDGHTGAIVLIDCETGETYRSDPTLTSEKHPPCSTFKIWNTAIGLETGKIASADDPFWKWDGVKRWREQWNQDQTLRTAFSGSCVPAYQDLARRIGEEQMTLWIGRLDYGDQNLASGLDVFWLPGKGRTPLLIDAEEQASLMAKLAKGDVPLSENTRQVLKEVMEVRKTATGTLYGKTGTGDDETGTNRLGWFVGYVESGGKSFAFATLIKGENLTGLDARTITEKILAELKLL